MRDEDTATMPRRRDRRRRSVALTAAGAVLLAGPMLGGIAATSALGSEAPTSEAASSYVPPNLSDYGTIEVKSGKIEAVTSNEAGKISLKGTDGTVKDHFAIQQLEVRGDGEFKVVDPAPAELPKNLNALSPTFIDIQTEEGTKPTSEEIESGVPTYAVFEDSVADNQTKQYRWLGLMDKNRIPFTMEPTYILDGQVYSNPEDLVGKSGRVEVRYKWNAIGQRPTNLFFKDGTGQSVKVEHDLYLPLVGVFKVPLPSTFTNVRGITMDAGGDGFGGTLLAGTLVMFPPLGPAEITVGFSADVRDFHMPTALVEWVLVNPPDNASFATIGSLLGTFGGLFGGIGGLAASLGPTLTTLGTTLDGLGGLFNGLTDVTKLLGTVSKSLGGLTAGVASVDKILGGIIDNGGELGDCDVVGTLGALVGLVSGKPAPEGLNFCSLLDLQTVAKGSLDSNVAFLDRMVAARLDPINAGVKEGLTALTLPNPAAGSYATQQKPGVCAAGTETKIPATETTPVSWQVNPKEAPFATNDPAIAENYDASEIPTLINILAAAAQDSVVRGLLESLAADLLPLLDDLYANGPVYSVKCAAATLTNGFPVKSGPILNLVLALVAPAGAQGQVNAFTEKVLGGLLTISIPDIPYTDAAPIEYLIESVKGMIGIATLDITIEVLRLLVGVQGLLADVVKLIANVGGGLTGIQTAIGSISTTVNSVLIGGLGKLLGGIGEAAPALATGIGSITSTINEEYAAFNAYGFLGTFGGAQPYGPPWSAADIPDFQVDPTSGAVINATPPSAGAPLPLPGEEAATEETTPAASGAPVPGVPPDPQDIGDPTIKAMDLAGYTAYQVDILGFGGERSSSSTTMFGVALLVLLLGGIGGALVMRSRRTG